MEITAGLVKELREKTGVGMMDCKKALTETNGNFDEAIKYLREKGLAQASKKSDRDAKEGHIFAQTGTTKGVIAEVNCETDFVANNDAFAAFGAKILDLAVANPSVKTGDDLQGLTVDGKSFKEFVSEFVFKMGENITIGNIAVYESAGNVYSYIHSNGKIGVLVEFSGNASEEIGKDIAMHIAASAPTYVQPSEVSAADVEREKEIIKNQALNEGQPEKILDKIIEGRISKFYKDVCLNEQAFVKDPEKAVKDILPAGVIVTRFVRYSL